MPGQFSGSAVIDRPIEEVFAFLAAGTNDPKFSPRVLEIRTETDGPPAARHGLREQGQGRRHDNRSPLRANRRTGANAQSAGASGHATS